MENIYFLPTTPPDRRFPFGTLVITSNASGKLDKRDVIAALDRHGRCDWGDLPPEDRKENKRSLQFGGRLFSRYCGRNGVRFWVITEADRSATTVLLPEDY
ncbi:MAG: hypothetical protein ACYC75_03410 [Minisyncoccota bacterium]